MKRLPMVFVTLAMLALAFAGCSNPVNAPNATVPAGEFQVFIDMDQAKGLYDYNVMHVYIKGFQVDEGGAPVALLNTSTQATTSNGKYLTELLPVYDEKSGYHDPFTRTQIGYTAWFKFDVGLAPNRALKFVAWAVQYNGVIEQFDAEQALRAWRENYMQTAECEQEAWAAMGVLAITKQDILDKMVDVEAAYIAAGTPYSPYPSWWWLPVLTAVQNLNAAYDAYMAILDSQAYVNWLASGVCGDVENNPASPAAAAKAAYDAALAAFTTAWSNYSAGTPSYPTEPSQVTDVTYDLFDLIMEQNMELGPLFDAWNCLANVWCEIRDLTNAPEYNVGSKQRLVVTKKAGEFTGHDVIYHTEADRYFPLPADGIRLYWTRGDFQVGNTGPAGGLVVGPVAPPSPLPDVSKSSWHKGYVDPMEPVDFPQIIEVSLADAAKGIGWYYSASILNGTWRDQNINAALVAANSIDALTFKYGTNGVTAWTLGSPAQIEALADYLDVEGYSNGNLVGKYPNTTKTYYWTYDPAITNNTGYGLSTASYDIDGVLDVVTNAAISGFGTSGLIGNVRPVMAWGGTSNWANNNTPWPVAQ